MKQKFKQWRQRFTQWLRLQPKVVQTACDFRAHAKAVVTHKHHYYTAFGISMGFLAIGFMEAHWHIAHWMYAIMETFVGGAKHE